MNRVASLTLHFTSFVRAANSPEHTTKIAFLGAFAAASIDKTKHVVTQHSHSFLFDFRLEIFVLRRINKRWNIDT
jgi:hypothetical protein